MTLVEFGGKSSGNTVIYCPGFTGSHTNTAARLDMAEIANAWQDEDRTPASVLVLPTSSMKKSVADKILETGSFSPLAEEIAPELNRHLTYYSDQVGIIGHSFGGRLAANIPNILDKPGSTELVAINDAPSWQIPLGIFSITAAQLIETIHLSKYIEHSPDSEAQKAWRKNNGGKTPAVPLLVQLRDVIAMLCGGFVEDLENSLDKLQPGAPVTLFVPELSHMNDNGPENIRKLITALS